MKRGMFEYGTIGSRRRGKVLGVRTPDRRTWVMTGCSALSGLMTFKDQTENYKDVDGTDLEELMRLGQELTNPRFFGFTNAGDLLESCQHDAYAALLAKAVEVSRLLKLGVGANPFLTVDEGYPYLTDGVTGFRLEWESYRMLLKFPLAFKHKVLKMILDPVHLDHNGRVLSPIQGAVDLVEKHEDVLCDPFADRNFSKKGSSIARQITPGMRQKVRAVTRGPKKP
jgi:hypothetical protein